MRSSHVVLDDGRAVAGAGLLLPATLANVGAHAQAQRVTIWLEGADDAMTLRISDNRGGLLFGVGHAKPGPCPPRAGQRA
jgi:signal transduction histidine kinase